MSIESLRQYAVLDGEQLESLWRAYDIQTQAANDSGDAARQLAATNAELRYALGGLLQFHQEGDDGAELPREYWTPNYRAMVEKAEALVGSNV